MADYIYEDGRVMDYEDRDYPFKVKEVIFRGEELEQFNEAVNFRIMMIEADTLEWKAKYQKLKEQYDGELSALRKEAEERDRMLEKARETCARLQKEAKEDSRHLEAERELNEGLKRICRERANAERGIRPKKEHPGYLLLSTGQWEETVSREISPEEWRSGHPDTDFAFYTPHIRSRVRVWKSVLQTPYQASLSFGSLEDTFWDELCLELAKLLGILEIQEYEKNGEYFTTQGLDGGPACALYKWFYRANARSGFWEMELYTTMELMAADFLYPGSTSGNDRARK